ncbi:glycosyltransferase family 2 protein [Effusibacillus dendaii]|uniref:Glycosyl transferase n=1 Tax=Effusibacillus dendaii TaxID=2743772 RepID=A0A7I8DFS7_9BACL|nr:glycosyltransferase family 2 protein [Effusibacillus dendaii]BCJ87799.1 glycosyl transferase [Effusibacillus dendaii]
MDLSIVIVSYNTKDLLIQTLDSVFRHTSGLYLEVFVVDNASSDGSPEAVTDLYPQVKIIRNQKNEGFAAANNQAIEQATGRYILLLNSDTIVQESTFHTMITYMDGHSKIGAAGCKVVKPDGTLDLACRRSFPTPMNSLYQALKLDKLFPQSPRFASYNLTYLDENEMYQVDCLVGAFMMVRRETIDQVGMLDDQFFMYGEDIDWCYRIKQAGWQIWYYPKTSIIHYKGASSAKKKYRMIWEFHRAMILYYRKHHAGNSIFLVNWLVYLGILSRYVMVATLNLFKKRGKQHDPLLSNPSQSHTYTA